MLKTQMQPFDQVYKAALSESAMMGAETAASKAPSEIFERTARGIKYLQPDPTRGIITSVNKDKEGNRTSAKDKHNWLVDPTTGKEIAYLGADTSYSSSGTGSRLSTVDADRLTSQFFYGEALANLQKQAGEGLGEARKMLALIRTNPENFKFHQMLKWLSPDRKKEAQKIYGMFLKRDADTARGLYNNLSENYNWSDSPEDFAPAQTEEGSTLGELWEKVKSTTGPAIEKIIGKISLGGGEAPTLTSREDIPKDESGKLQEGFVFKNAQGQMFIVKNGKTIEYEETE